MRVIFCFLVKLVFSGWVTDVEETANFLIRVGATKYEVARGIQEMLHNRKWTDFFNFLVIGIGTVLSFRKIYFGTYCIC